MLEKPTLRLAGEAGITGGLVFDGLEHVRKAGRPLFLFLQIAENCFLNYGIIIFDKKRAATNSFFPFPGRCSNDIWEERI